jgi:hypothetical protein
LGLGVMVLALAVGVAIRSKPGGPSVWAGRMFYLGFGLMMLGPGLGVVGAVALGKMMWPALLGAVVLMLFGGGVLYGLRLNWNDPWRGTPGVEPRDIERR